MRTPLDARNAKTLLAQAWAGVLGRAPDPKAISVLTAHWALETDSGRAMQGHNFAGIKAGPAAAGAAFRTVEGHGATRREVVARFRVYDSAEAGAHDYVRLLAVRYPAGLDAASTGSVSGFAQALAQGGYFSADPEAYRQGLARRFEALETGAVSGPVGNASSGAGCVLNGLLHAFRYDADDP